MKDELIMMAKNMPEKSINRSLTQLARLTYRPKTTTFVQKVCMEARIILNEELHSRLLTKPSSHEDNTNHNTR